MNLVKNIMACAHPLDVYLLSLHSIYDMQKIYHVINVAEFGIALLF